MVQVLKVYVDMDGVLADFDKHFTNLFGMEPKKFEEINGQKKFWKNVFSVDDFFSTIPAFDGINEMMNAIYRITPNVMILSSPASSNTKHCVDQKRKWLSENLDFQIPAIFESKKYIYADKNSILIDDRKDKLEKWNEHGGIGLLFKSTDLIKAYFETMFEVDRIVDRISGHCEYLKVLLGDRKCNPIGVKRLQEVASELDFDSFQHLIRYIAMG